VQAVLIPVFEDEAPFDFPFSREVNQEVRHSERAHKYHSGESCLVWAVPVEVPHKADEESAVEYEEEGVQHVHELGGC
jgi:hypothetical protein